MTFQLFGGILFGRFGDVCGGPLALGVAHTASFLTYAMLGSATALHSPALVLLAQSPTCLQHGFQAARMVAAMNSDSSRRLVAIGRLFVSYGAGGIVGPLLASACVKSYGLAFSVFVAAGIE